jgi:hypothetical protein
MTTNKEMNAAEIIAAAVKAATERNAKGLKGLWQAAESLAVDADRSSVQGRMTAAITAGEIIAAAVIIDSDGKQELHTAPQKVCGAAALKAGITVSDDHAKRCLRAALYCGGSNADRLTAAIAKLGKADGPESSQMIHVVKFCQAQDSQGRAQMAAAVKDAKTPAAAKALVTKAAADSTKAANAAASLVKAAASLKLGNEIVAANDDTVYGPLTASRWTAATVTALDEIIATAQAVKAAKVKAAKDAKAKAPKGTKAKVTKAAAPQPGSDEFNAAVAAAVAAAMAAAAAE